jgi:hypothetical protein
MEMKQSTPVNIIIIITVCVPFEEKKNLSVNKPEIFKYKYSVSHKPKVLYALFFSAFVSWSAKLPI